MNFYKGSFVYNKMKRKIFIFSIFFLLSLTCVSAQITGTVRNSLSSPLQGVVVEAWQTDNLITSTTTNSLGQYTLAGLTNGIQYTVRAYNFTQTSNKNSDPLQCWDEDHVGFIPQTQNIVDPATNINFNLNSLPIINISQYFAQFYGLGSTFNNYFLRKGDVITTRDTQGITNGLGINCWSDNRGWYVLYAFGDDSGTIPDEGSLNGELINFYINGVLAINTSGTRDWYQGGGGNTEISTSGAAATCTITNASWNQGTATQGQIINLSIDSTGCNGQEILFTIREGGIVSRGNAVVQPLTATVDYTGIATTTWIAEWVNDAGGGDTNPPEYYFIASLVSNSSNNLSSATLNNFLLTSQHTTSPIISNVNLNIFGDNAIITWNTDEPSTSQIDYGKTISYGSNKINNTLTYTPLVVLNNLDLDVTYYYRIISTDAYGNTNNTINNSFIITSPATITLQEGIYRYYYGVKDTYLYSQGNLDIGGLQDIKVGERLANGDISYPILWFNTSVIGSSATIVSAHLDLNMFEVSEGTNNVIAELYRVIRPWGTQGTGTTGPAPIGIVTWDYSFYNTTSWGIPGAGQTGVDREATPQDPITFTSTSPFGWYSWDLNLSMIGEWILNPSQNNGIIIRSTPSGIATRYRFRSSEYTTTLGDRPKLVITFTKGGATICSDINSDGRINIIDLAIVIFNQGRNSGQPNWINYDHLDFDSNGQINWVDVSYVRNRIGSTC